MLHNPYLLTAAVALASMLIAVCIAGARTGTVIGVLLNAGCMCCASYGVLACFQVQGASLCIAVFFIFAFAWVGLNALILDFTKAHVAIAKATYSETHERNVTSFDYLPGIDRRGLAQAQGEMERLGFTFVADIEDTTVSRASNGNRAPTRYMISDDGTMVAEISYFNYSLFHWLLARFCLGVRSRVMVAVASFYADGTVVIVNGTPANAAISEPHNIVSINVGVNVAIEDVYRIARERAGAIAGKIPAPIRNVRDILEAERRLDGMRHAYRKRVGLFAREDFILQGVSEEKIPERLRGVERFYKDDPEWGRSRLS